MRDSRRGPARAGWVVGCFTAVPSYIPKMYSTSTSYNNGPPAPAAAAPAATSGASAAVPLLAVAACVVAVL